MWGFLIREPGVFRKNKSNMEIIEIPSMPVIPNYVDRHRPRIPAYMNVFNAMVVRTVKRKDAQHAGSHESHG